MKIALCLEPLRGPNLSKLKKDILPWNDSEDPKPKIVVFASNNIMDFYKTIYI